MKTKRLIFALCALVVTVSFAGSSIAQNQTWSLDIADGHVKVNGVLLKADAVPRTLNVAGPGIHVELVAFGKPIVAIGDAVYAIEKDRIRDATPEEIEEFGVLPVFQLSDDDARRLVAISLKEIQRNASLSPSELVQENVRGNAMRASQMVAALPYLEKQSYLNDVRTNDEPLYKSLLQERQVEIEVASLVGTIRRLPDGPTRTKAVADLRAKLVLLFDMKQGNRRSEISEMEEQLDILTKRTKKREGMKDRIVDKRLSELLEGSR